MASAAQEEYTLVAIYNIAGKDDEVVEKLKTIVNSNDYKDKAVFNFMLLPASNSKSLGLDHFQSRLEKWQTQPNRTHFCLEAIPRKNQPGNGKIYICKDGKFIARPYGQEMITDLEETYKVGGTSNFAEDLKSLFENNETIANYPLVTSEVYMLLLFEIGRRLVKDTSESTPQKVAIDKLQIKEAIQGILTLLGNGKCTFRDVFSKEGKFHCFTGSTDKREKTIEKIIKAAQSATDGERETESRISYDSLSEKFRANLSLQ